MRAPRESSHEDGMIYASAAGRMYVRSNEDGVIYASAAGRMYVRSNEDGVIYASAAGRMYLRSNEDGVIYASAAGRMSWRSNKLRLAYADSGSACKLAQDMVPTAHTRNDVRFRSCVLGSNLFASSAVGKFSRASSAGGRRRLLKIIRELDRVGRRGLFEPREDFSRLLTYAFLWLFPQLFRHLDSAITRYCIQNSSPNTL